MQSNVSNWTNTTPISTMETVSSGGTAGVVLLCAPVLVFSVLTYCAVRQCTAMPHQVRLISSSFLLSDSIFQLLLIIHQLLLLMTLDKNYVQLSRDFLSELTLSTTMAFIAMLAVERVVAVKIPFWHARWLTKRRALLLVIGNWLVSGVAPTCPMILTIIQTSADHSSAFIYANTAYTGRIVHVGFNFAYELITIACYAIVLNIVRRHRRAISSLQPGQLGSGVSQGAVMSRRQLMSLKFSGYIFLASFVLYIPYGFNSVIYSPNDFSQRSSFFAFFAFICLQTSTVFSCAVFVWKSPEVRLKFMVMFQFFSPHLKRKAERMRMQVYSIVSLTDSRTFSGQTT